MKAISEMPIGEFAAFVCAHLFSHGIKAVLSGGACVSLYTNNRHQSYDIDLIDNASVPRSKLRAILSEIGFYEENRYYRHNDSAFFVEFPAGPLAVGSEAVKLINEMEFETGKIFLLMPDDCVKDRLCAFFFWDDRQSLSHAVDVAVAQYVNMDEIRRWSELEGMANKFEEFLRLVKEKS